MQLWFCRQRDETFSGLRTEAAGLGTRTGRPPWDSTPRVVRHRSAVREPPVDGAAWRGCPSQRPPRRLASVLDAVTEDGVQHPLLA